jgi:type IV secretion system protein TrbJ
MKKILLASIVALMTCVTNVRPAAAFPVIDVANLIQNTLAAIQQIQQISHQITQITNQATSLANEAKNLASLPYNVVSQLRAATDQVDQLISQAQGIAFDVNNSINQFKTLYPKSFSSAMTQSQLAMDTMKRWERSMEAIETTVKVQSQATQNFASDQSALIDLVSQSQSASGALQATQVTNQLLALHSRQLIQDQQLRVAQDRATALEQARMVAANARGEVVRQKFMTTNTRYTPETVTFYPN